MADKNKNEKKPLILPGLDYQISMVLNKDDLSEGDLPIPKITSRRILIVYSAETVREKDRLSEEFTKYFSGELEVSFGSPEEMQSKYVKEIFDLIVIELPSPTSNWIEVFHSARAIFRDLPIVILSAFEVNDLAVRAFKDGAADFVVKRGDVSSWGNSLLLCVERTKAQQLKRASMKMEKQAVRDAFEHSPVLMIRVDSQFKLRDCNALFAREMKSDPRSLKGKRIFELVPTLDSAAVKKAIGTGETSKTRLVTEEVRQGKAYKKCWDLFIWPVYRTLGHGPEVIITGVDVSKEVLLESERDEFIAALAHDLRNPIVGHNMVLAKLLEAPADESIKTYLDTLRRSNVELLSLLDTLMNTYSMDARPRDQAAKPVDMEKQLRDHVSLVSHLASLSNKQIILNIKTESKMVMVDECAMSRVISNLLHNAIRHSRNDTEIEIVLYSEGELLLCEVKNRPESLVLEESLFERFTKTNVKPHSSGYGLFLTRKLARAMGADVSYTRGTDLVTFTVSIPLTT